MKAFKVPKTREEQIEALVEDVENWDHDVLVDAVKDGIADDLEKMTDAEVEERYDSNFGIEGQDVPG